MTSKLADAWFDAFRTKDLSILESNLADDFVHSSPFGEIDGKGKYVDLVKAHQGAFFDHKLEIVDIIEDGEKCAVRYIVDGTPACDCIYAKDEKITKVIAYLHVGELPKL